MEERMLAGKNLQATQHSLPSTMARDWSGNCAIRCSSGTFDSLLSRSVLWRPRSPCALFCGSTRLRSIAARAGSSSSGRSRLRASTRGDLRGEDSVAVSPPSGGSGMYSVSGSIQQMTSSFLNLACFLSLNTLTLARPLLAKSPALPMRRKIASSPVADTLTLAPAGQLCEELYAAAPAAAPGGGEPLSALEAFAAAPERTGDAATLPVGSAGG
eukprot:5532912-Prymnesium_polylepis.2